MNAVFKLEGKIISRSTQSEIFSHKIGDKTYFVKRYFRSKGLGSWLGFSRLRVEARNQQWFNKTGVSAAPVVAYGEKSFFLKTIRGALITEGIDDGTDLAWIAKNSPEKFQDSHWCRTVILDLAKVMTTLHESRFCHIESLRSWRVWTSWHQTT